MKAAVRHARIYCELINGHSPSADSLSPTLAEGRSHQNVGMLHELLGDHERALGHYKQFLSMSKAKGHKRGIAQAYGCLGSIYGHLGNRQLALTYHEQHIAMCRKVNGFDTCCLLLNELIVP